MPDFTLHYRVIAIKRAWLKNRYENEWNQIEDSDINLYNYSDLIFDKDAQNI
jgi:hypothetical protein